MELLSAICWWCGEFFLACLAYRAWKARLFSRYPFFWGYLIYVAESQVPQFYFQSRHPPGWVLGWWIMEIFGALFGFAVVWEVFAQLLRPFPGAHRMARSVVAALLVLVLGKGGVELMRTSFHTLMPTTVEIDRNLRVVQALLLLAILGLVVYYAIPMGRNVRAMLVGYGFYIGGSVIALTLLSSQGQALRAFLNALPGFCYCVTLGIWCIGMWSWYPNPASSARLDRDYERLSRHTLRAMDRLRSHLIQSWRI